MMDCRSKSSISSLALSKFIPVRSTYGDDGPLELTWQCYSGNRSQTEDTSWWPKHSAWVKGGTYTGIWSPWQEHWFQERLKAIWAGRAGPLNGAEWKDRLKGFKKAGDLAQRLDNACWDVTFRNLVQRTE